MSTRNDEMVRALDALKASAARISDDVRDLGSDAILTVMTPQDMQDRVDRIRLDLDCHFHAVWRKHKEFQDG